MEIYPSDHRFGVRDPECPSPGEVWYPYHPQLRNGEFGDAMYIVKVEDGKVTYWAENELFRKKGYVTDIAFFRTKYHPRFKAERDDGKADWLQWEWSKGNTSVGPWIWEDPEHQKHLKYSLKPKNCKACHPELYR